MWAELYELFLESFLTDIDSIPLYSELNFYNVKCILTIICDLYNIIYRANWSIYHNLLPREMITRTQLFYYYFYNLLLFLLFYYYIYCYFYYFFNHFYYYFYYFTIIFTVIFTILQLFFRFLLALILQKLIKKSTDYTTLFNEYLPCYFAKAL